MTGSMKDWLKNSTKNSTNEELDDAAGEDLLDVRVPVARRAADCSPWTKVGVNSLGAVCQHEWALTAARSRASRNELLK